MYTGNINNIFDPTKLLDLLCKNISNRVFLKHSIYKKEDKLSTP